jgi:cyclase
VTGALHDLAPGVYAWLADDPRQPNAGVVVDEDGITVVDTLMVPSQAEPFAAAVEALGPPIRRVVLTSSHLPYVGGSTRLRRAAVYGTAQVSAHLDQPTDVMVLRRLFPAQADELDEEFTTRPVTHVVRESGPITPAVEVATVTGDLDENLVVVVPGAGVVFGGGVCSFGITPLAYQSDPGRWADSLADLTALGTTVVPGHGAIGGADELLTQAAYLLACVDAAGDPAAIAPGPWDDWDDRDNDEVNVERAAMLARGETDIPPSMLRRAGLA